MRGGVTIHVFKPGSLPVSAAGSLLDGHERARSDRFRFEKDAFHWIQCRAALRLALGAATGRPAASLAFSEGVHGKPALAEGPHFNLSHCPDLALIALRDDAPVGIDVESRLRAADLAGCEETFCHPDEIAALPSEPSARHVRLLRIWTAKESFLKALGTGLSQAPQEVRVHFPSRKASTDRPLAGLADLELHELAAPGISGHVAMLATPPFSGPIAWIDGVASPSGELRAIDRS